METGKNPKHTKTSWPKGVSGNRGGRPKKGESFADIIRRYGDDQHCEIVLPDGTTRTVTWKEAVVIKQYLLALNESDIVAMRDIQHRSDGAPVQRIQGPDDSEGNPTPAFTCIEKRSFKEWQQDTLSETPPDGNPKTGKP